MTAVQSLTLWSAIFGASGSLIMFLTLAKPFEIAGLGSEVLNKANAAIREWNKMSRWTQPIGLLFVMTALF
jgi:hypothetical protein